MNNIEPKYVTFEQAQWLQDKNFKVWCKFRYTDFNGNIQLEENASEIFPFVPEQWQVVEWFRLNYDIWVEAPYSYNDGNVYCWSIVRINQGESDKNCWLSGLDTKIVGFDTPQEAYSAAFDYIKENNLI